MKPGNEILSGYGTTVFEVMSRLAMEHGTINLGQGFPDENGPDDVRDVAAQTLLEGPNQYPPMLGVPELRQAVAAHNKRFYGVDVDWQTEVMVTSGATESLAACMFALLDKGDEVVLFEPLYDSYLPIVRRAGAVPKLVRLEPPDWRLPMDQLTAAFSERTKLVLLNNPMNPTGKVFTFDELAAIAKLVEQYDAYALCDEVYEHIYYEGAEFTSFMTVPGMRRRTLRIGSAGKTFSLTGWKVGYTTAPPDLLGLVAKAHQFLTFTTPPNLQKAVAYGLGKDDAYFSGLASEMQGKRDLIRAGLKRVGFDVAVCDGTYFINADFRPLGFDSDDVAFCRHITEHAGVTALPVSAFYQGGGVDHLARFCFSKQDAVLEEAVARLAKYFG
ncbi:MAG: aminotransferase [Minwuiales bacterium]|nr:aminotransferase [Minwuiales bacterium]